MNPIFAVVGHPNKGKSSIVATLTQNDQIAISPRSGTTTESTGYRIQTASGQVELIDTPGFQRPVSALRWLEAKASNASERSAAVTAFVNDLEAREKFPDEVQLLAPISQGAAILYVVDGSRPYGAEFEAEMEILRWSGQPSMALINPIENDGYVDQWREALQQFFKSVHVFNPLTAEFDKQLALLEVFAHLRPSWKETLQAITADLKHSRAIQHQQSADLLSELLHEMCNYRVEQKLLSQQQAKQAAPLLQRQFQQYLIKQERSAFQSLLAIYGHTQNQLFESELELPPDLFATEQWYAWGLNKKQLVAASAAAGALGGVSLDVLTAGHSLMLGALGGGLIGAGSAVFGANKMAKLKISGLPVSGNKAIYGPIKHANFPYVVLGRFLFMHRQIAGLNHANHQDIQLSRDAANQSIASLEQDARKELHKACARLVRQKSVDDLPGICLQLLGKT